ncbi:MAG: pyridoxamine 5'-phosphate oxidase family protein [Lapillicoccus sp.]
MRDGDGIRRGSEHDRGEDDRGEDPLAGARSAPEVLGDDVDRAPADPMRLAAAWAGDAAYRAPLESVLATVGVDGAPEARTVLVSRLDDDGFHVNTQAGSAKALALQATPKAALVVRFADFGRQLSAQADVVPQTPEQAAAVYRERSPYLRTLAWLNDPEYAALPAEERERRWAAFDLDGAGVLPPEGWTGFVLRPWRLVFWATSTTMASRRLEYVRDDEGWRRSLLPG